MLPVIAAGAAALFLIWGFPADTDVYAEDSVVADSSPASADAPEPEETNAGVVDPMQVDGLFEVISEKSGYAGETAEDPDAVKDKKKKNNEKQLIVGYKQVGVQASISFEMGEKPSLERLKQQFPSKLDVYFLGEEKAQSLNVTWESYGDDYSSTNLNYYFFTPKFDPDKYEVKGLNLQSQSPYIEVIQNAFTYEMIESAPPKENEAAVVKYCMEKLKLNTAATCGVLANIYCESGFRTNAIGDGGTSVGICQWHNGRWTNLRNFAPDDWQTLEGQLRFMRKELRTGYRATWNYLQNVTDDEQGAYDAAYYWCMHYEMPDKILSRSTTRGYLAKNVYWKRYGLGEEETEAETDSSSEAGDQNADAQADSSSESEVQDADTQADPSSETEGQATDTHANPSAEAAGSAEADRSADEGALTKEASDPAREEAAAAPSEPEAGKQPDETEDKPAEPEDGSGTDDAEAEAELKAADRKKEPQAEGGTQKETIPGAYLCISDDGLNIREEADIDSKAIGSIPYQGVVTVLSGDGEWARIRYEGKEGYSKLEFLERDKAEDKKD